MRTASRAALGNRSFRRTWITLLAGSSGMYGMILAAGVFLYQQHHSATASTATYTALLLPTVLVGPAAGAWADRSGPVVVMRSGLVLALGATGLLLGLVAVHAAPMAAVIGCCLLAGSGRAGYGTAWQSMVSGLVSAESLVGAGALIQTAVRGGQFLGPALVGTAAGLGSGTAGTDAGLAICVGFYLVGTGAAMLLPQPPPAAGTASQTPDRSTPNHPVREAVSGFRQVIRDPRLGPLLWFVGAHCALTMAYMGLLPALAAAHLHSAEDAGPLMTFAGLGALLGCFALIPASGARPAVLALVTGVPSGAALVGLAMAHSTIVAAVAAAVAGASQAAFMAVIYALSQTLAPTRLRARVASIQGALTAGSMSLVALAWGALAAAGGPALALALPAAAFVVLCLIAPGVVPSVRLRSGGPAPVPAAVGLAED